MTAGGWKATLWALRPAADSLCDPRHVSLPPFHPLATRERGDLAANPCPLAPSSLWGFQSTSRHECAGRRLGRSHPGRTALMRRTGKTQCARMLCTRRGAPVTVAGLAGESRTKPPTGLAASNPAAARPRARKDVPVHAREPRGDTFPTEAESLISNARHPQLGPGGQDKFPALQDIPYENNAFFASVFHTKCHSFQQKHEGGKASAALRNSPRLVFQHP